MNRSIEEFGSALAWAIDAAGGPIQAAKVCGLSRQSIDKWIARGQLPRTEYTGETSYAASLAGKAKDLGVPFEAEWLLSQAAPKKPEAA